MKRLMKFFVDTFVVTLCLFNIKAESQSVCAQYLNDFVPKTNDSVLIINVNFVVFSPTAGSSVWSGNATRADNCIRIMDSIYANVPAPKLTISGVSMISHTKIKFKRKNFSVVQDTNAYFYLFNPANTSAYVDTNALNVFYGYGPYSNSTPFSPGIRSRFYALNSTDIGNYFTSIGVAHEAGHMLGLAHTTSLSVYFTGFPPGWRSGDGPTNIYPSSGCCTTLTATDYVLADSLIYRQCALPLGGNNLMDETSGCLQYLSPQQMAVIHYYLRTDLSRVLTSFSYNNHLNRNAASDFTVSTSQSWNIDRYFKGNITIKAGATLTLSCQLALTQNARIFVERQAQLIIDGGTITNISGHPWASIHVAGDPGQDQSFNPTTGYGNYQGMLRVKNGGTLSKAGTAIANYTVDASNNVQWGSTGGIIIAENANFFDNSRDVEFLSYSPPSASYFKNCQFKTLGRIGSTLQPFAHVTFYKVNNVRFMGCNFEYAAGTTYTTHGMGFFGGDSKYSVDKLCGSAGTLCATPSTFKNLDFGIKVLNINPLAVISVNNCRFEGNIYDGMYIHTMDGAVFNQNYFDVPVGITGNCGIYLNYCKRYTVKNSTFLQEGGWSSMGMFILKSEIGKHEVYRNSFGGFNTAIAALNNNSGYNNNVNGLKMNCNDFTSSTNQFDIAMYPTTWAAATGFNAPTVMRKQGEISSPTANNLVRNKYGANCSNSARWFASGPGTNTLQILHGCNSNSLSAGVTEPNPQPSCSNTIVIATAFPIAFNYTADCLPSPESAGGTFTSSAEKLDNLNSRISDLLSEGVGADQFELQATVVSKLNHYLTDSLPSSMDTVIQILTDNPGNLDNADILLVFAHLSKGDYINAFTLANALNGDRADWGELLLKLVEIYQEPGGIFCPDAENTYFDFFTELANSEGKDGQDCAQAFLKLVKGTDYEVFRPYPEAEESERYAQPTAIDVTKVKTNKEYINIYPNPAQSDVKVVYYSKKNGPALIEVKDLLGKVIYRNFIYNENELIIQLKDYSNGVYIISVSKNRELLYQTKLIKQGQ
jgi:hypothetical protein